MQAVIFCGIQAAGKTTFYMQRFFKTHIRINLDMLKTRQREHMLLHACLVMKQPFVVDNTNLRLEDRKRYIEPAQKAHFRVIGYYFEADAKEALARNRLRAENERVPAQAIYAARARMQVPSRDEGFNELYCVRLIESGGFDLAEM